MLFARCINNIEDWAGLFQDREVFAPLAEYIFSRHGLEYSGMEACTPGSNAVFRAGRYIVKIFAPNESGIGAEEDFLTEKFGIGRANQLGIAAPELIAWGVVADRYVFRYLILSFVEGESLAKVSGMLSDKERFRIGQKLRKIVNRMDTACEKFNGHILFGKQAEDRWKAFPLEFQRERKKYLEAVGKKPEVYVHGDLNPDNIIVGADGEIYIIDFADAMIAPIELEQASILCDGFKFDSAYRSGFAGEYEKTALTEQLLYGLLIHDFGLNIIRDNLCAPSEISSLGQLRDRIHEKL